MTPTIKWGPNNMVATDTRIYWKILEDTGKVNILEKHTGKHVFLTSILEIYWKKVIVPPKKNSNPNLKCLLSLLQNPTLDYFCLF